MSSLDTQLDKQKISEILERACETTLVRARIVEFEEYHPYFRTMLVLEKDHTSYLYGYMNYYSGVCECFFFSMFYDEFKRPPTADEKKFIKEIYDEKFEKLKNNLVDFATKAYHADSAKNKS